MAELAFRFRTRAHQALLSAVIGILAGVVATLFLFALNWITQLREHNPRLIYALPACGFLTGLAYHHLGGRAGRAPRLLLEEVHEPGAGIPARLTPLVFAGTLLTHLGGGSAGREGTAVQMAGSLADGIARWRKVDSGTRTELLMAGLGAGFGAAVGAPLAGIIFGMEVVATGRLRFRGFYCVATASLFSFLTTHFLKAPHSAYPVAAFAAASGRQLLLAPLAGIAFGLAARAFLLLAHGVESAGRRWVPYPPLRPLLGGCLVVALFFYLGHLRYAGLGIPVIGEALRGMAYTGDPGGKALATALTVGSGLKGGEFIPLVFVGSTLGALLGLWLSLPGPFLASLGFAAVFGAAANVPLASAVMAGELFGAGLFPYAFLASYTAYLCSGGGSVYPGQPRLRGKHHMFLKVFARIRRRSRDETG